MRKLITSKFRGFLTSPDLRTEPGKSRLNLLLCALAVSSLSLLSTACHTEPTVMVAMQKDGAMLRSTGADAVRQARSAALTTVGYMAQIGGW
ncbi:hypothetical protein [Armatimonas rosea]|uniref:Uncharacterized protein n=1 Tax=Armatimonas rosea TaxID=685828 RepID=A0A7W9W9K8_ARMRO|nr:hypothetical protein [Armatimonas rosea]MBB6053325.1 hypothetical protein [Armatimonas rosea]